MFVKHSTFVQNQTHYICSSHKWFASLKRFFSFSNNVDRGTTFKRKDMFSTILFLQMPYYNCVPLDAGAHIIAIDNVFATNRKTTSTSNTLTSHNFGPPWSALAWPPSWVELGASRQRRRRRSRRCANDCQRTPQRAGTPSPGFDWFQNKNFTVMWENLAESLDDDCMETGVGAHSLVQQRFCLNSKLNAPDHRYLLVFQRH